MKLRFYFCAILLACSGLLVSTQKYTGNDVAQQFQALISILKSDVWVNDVSKQLIMYNGKINNLKILQKKLKEILSDKDKHETMILLKTLSRYSTMTYTSLQCKYAGLIVKALTFYFHTADTLNCLVSLKQHVTKMIFNLFNFNDIFPNLRHTDQALLIALITMNVNIDSRPYYDTDEKKLAIARTIHSVELFRCKNCLVPDSDYYSVYDVAKNSDNLLSDSVPTTQMAILLDEFDTYSREIDIESQAGLYKSAYYQEMFDPANFMLGSMIVDAHQDVGKLTVKMGQGTNLDLQDVVGYSLTNATDINGLLDYQMMYVEILKDIFCVVFTELYASKRNAAKLTKALEAYDVFTDRILPNNYPLDMYDRIKFIGTSVRGDLDETANKKLRKTLRVYSKMGGKIDRTVTLSAETEDLLKVTKIVISDLTSELMKTLDVDVFVRSVVDHGNFENYRKMFGFLLNQKTVLYADRSLSVTSPPGGNYRPDDMRYDLLDLRKNLFLYRSLLAGIDQRRYLAATKSNGQSMIALTAMELVKRNLAYVHDRYGKDGGKLAEILAPVTIYFERVTYANDLGESKWQLVKQYLLLTVNLLEGYELNGHVDPSEIELNLEMYRSIAKDKNMYRTDAGGDVVNHPVNFDLERVRDRIVNGTKHMASDFVSQRLSWVRKFVPNAYFNYDIEFNSNTVAWNGVDEYVANVGRSITWNVIDYNYLVKFQMRAIKWLVHNVFKKMMYTHLLRGSGTSDEHEFSQINDDFELFRNLSFPSRIQSFIDPIFLKYLNTFSTAYDSETAKKFTDFLGKKIKRLKLSETENNFKFLESKYSLQDIQRFVKNDIQYAGEILAFIKDSGVISETDFFFLY